MVVGISGGPDSTALLLALRELGHDVVAAHYDHALRPDSQDDAAHVAALASSLAIPLIQERREAPLDRGSVQAAARTARYDFLERARRNAGAELIATAHTLDDHVETVLMNVLRGAGLDGVRGIPARNGRVVRPLLAATRADVEAYLAASSPALVVRADPSNRNLRFLRARVRHLLIPDLLEATPDLRARLDRLARRARAAHDRLEGEATIDAAEPAARILALRGLYRNAGGRSPGLSAWHLSAMDQLVASRRTGASLSLPGGMTFRVLPDGRPVIEGTRRHSTVRVRERQCDGCRDADAVHVSGQGTLSLATRTPGLRMRTRAGTRKLQDLFVDAKVPRHERDSRPLVLLDGRLAWVPGIAEDPEITTSKSRPGRHVWLEIEPERPVVRSEH